MKNKLLAALVALVALPVAAQSAVSRAAPEGASAKVQATDKERARLAKKQNMQGKQDCRLAKQKQDKKTSPAG